MTTILDRIIESKRREIETARRAVSEEELERRIVNLLRAETSHRHFRGQTKSR